MMCELCREAPASVFKPTMAVCKPCHRELARREAEDNVVPNGPACSTCATLLNASGTCPECVVRIMVESWRQMARVS
jgi:hypothetical protein